MAHLTVSRSGRKHSSLKERAGVKRTPRKWSPNKKIKLLVAVIASAATIAAAVITPLLTRDGNGGSGGAGQSQVNMNNNKGQVAFGGGTINNYGSTASVAGLSNDPQARIVELTGFWSEQGFVDAIRRLVAVLDCPAGARV